MLYYLINLRTWLKYDIIDYYRCYFLYAETSLSQYALISDLFGSVKTAFGVNELFTVWVQTVLLACIPENVSACVCL